MAVTLQYNLQSHYAKWTYKCNIFVHINKNTTATDTTYTIAKYVPEISMLLKCHICQLVHMQISENYVSIYNLI